ncbi:MAG: bifunctional oligoribonuclease/PAP phosphatase NrnA [Oscillospiraceae bacterium]|nr:bifunctional oligoribonuclease/PAP phosphatase NrnA [Oscillospiraceae bacterium]
MNYKQCAKLLLTHENILIVTHRNPDGDTVGSAAALCSALRRAGRTAWLYPNPQIAGKLLEYCGCFFAPGGFTPKYVVSVDVAEQTLFPDGFAGAVDLCVDHHPSNSGFAAESFVKPEKASCAELVLELILNINTELTAQEATLLYIGLSTDTGCFLYANTNAAAFRAAAELLRFGADSQEINQRFFRKVSPARLKLESMIYGSLRFYRDGQITVACVTREMIEKSGVTDDELDDLAGLAGRAEGSELSITIRELKDGTSKVSVRSSDKVSSCAICEVFGGGGHVRASGCTIYGDAEKAREMLLNVIDEVWK